jgi:hypothetical protein
VSQAAEASVKTGKTPARGKVLDDTQLADVFGIELGGPAPEAEKKPAKTPAKKPATGRKPANSTTGKPASRKAAASAPARAKRKTAQT